MIKKLQDSKQFESIYANMGYKKHTVSQAMKTITKILAQIPKDGIIFVHHSKAGHVLAIDNWVHIKKVSRYPKTLKIGNSKYTPWTPGVVSKARILSELQELAAYNFGLWTFQSHVVVLVKER
jgi:hypothetical protein